MMMIWDNEARLLKNMFPEVTDSTIEKVLSVAKVVEYPPKRMLCRQGEVADTFYILLEGTVGVYLEVEANDEIYQIDKIRHGCFGEVALMLNTRRTAFIITKEPVKVLEISRTSFDSLSVEIPEFSQAVAKMLIRRLVEQDERKIVRLHPKANEQASESVPQWVMHRLAERQTEGSLEEIRASREVKVKPIWGQPRKDTQYETDIFVIMPFKDEFNVIYEHYIKRVALEMGLRIKRGDDPFVGSSPIIDEIWAIMNAARLIIADCTGNNPNVFYELGIAHTLGKPTIILTQDGNVPFDVKHQRYIRYEDSTSGMPKLQDNLREALRKILNIAKTRED